MIDLNELRSRVKALHDVLGLNVLADVLCLIDESGGLEMTDPHVKSNAENLKLESVIRPDLEYRITVYANGRRTASERAYLCDDRCGAVVAMAFVHQAFHEESGGYVWAWLKDDASGEVHHPLVLPTAQDQFETWPELVGRNEPDALGRRVKLYRLVEVLPRGGRMTTFGADPVGFLWKEYDAAIAAGDTAAAEHALGNINEWCGLPRDWRSLSERREEAGGWAVTQHLADGRWADTTDGTKYHTACGRWVTSAQANGPSGVTCKACKRAMEAGQ